jgi:hypothetical protein
VIHIKTLFAFFQELATYFSLVGMPIRKKYGDKIVQICKMIAGRRNASSSCLFEFVNQILQSGSSENAGFSIMMKQNHVCLLNF